MIDGPHQGQPVRHKGRALAAAEAVMILIHGRGATAASILELAPLLHHEALAYLAPEAQAFTWYPTSFLAPIPQNEPGISSGLQLISEIMNEVSAAGIAKEKVIIGGFSQGACLAAEYVARNAIRYGGLLIFSGGLIGPPGTPRSYEGSLAGTPIFIGCSDRDAHIPLTRVQETSNVLTGLGGQVNEKIYKGMGHTINEDEIEQASAIVQTLFPD